MELLHNLWNIVSTEDENLVNYMLIFLGIIESYVTMKLFTTVLDISYTKKQRNLYIIIMEIIMILSIILIPNEFTIFYHLFLTFFIIKFVFKTSIMKAILAEILPMLIITLFETLYSKLCFKLFGIYIVDGANIIIYRIPYMLILYLTLYLFSHLVKFIKLNFNSFEKLSPTHKRLLIINLILIVICIGLQFYLIAYYTSVLPIFITVISLIFLITYSLVSIYSIIKTLNLEMTKTNLEQSQLHNKTLELLYNNTRAFKHDFSNILTAFGGYLFAKDIDGLSKYYDKVLEECHINNNLSTLNPEVINNPAIYNILATKYYNADELNIKIDLQVFINLNELKMDVYDFSRIMGILLDNAIEAAAQCSDKLIRIEIRDIKPRKCQVLTIENTYLNNDIDLSKLSEKGYTTKTDDAENHGIGLWQVAKMLKKSKNVLLDTSKTDTLFKQELAIYYK